MQGLPVAAVTAGEGEAVAGRPDLPEGQGGRGGQGEDPGLQGLLRAAQHAPDSLDAGRVVLPVLGLFLDHDPEADALGDFAVAAVGQQVTDERVGIELALEQAAPGHDGIGIIGAAAAVRLGVLEERFDVLVERAAETVPGEEGNAPGAGEGRSGVARQQGAQGLHPAALGEDPAVQAADLAGHEIGLGLLAEFAQAFAFGLGGEGHLRIQGADMQVLLEAEAAAPDGPRAVAQEAPVEELDRGRDGLRKRLRAGVAHIGEPFQQGGGEDGRGGHAREPAEAAVAAPAGENPAHHVGPLLRRGGGARRAGQTVDQEVGVERLGLVEQVFARRQDLLRDGFPDHVEDGNLTQGRFGARHVDELAAQRGEDRLAVHPGEQQGGVGFGDGLYGRADRHRDEHGVGAVVRVVGREADQQAELVHLGRGELAAEVGRAAGGDAEVLAALAQHGGGLVVFPVEEADADAAGDGRALAAGHGHARHVAVAFVEELRLHDGHLDRQGHDHLLAEDLVAEGLVVREKLHIISGKLVGGAEAERHHAVLVGAQERLPGDRIGEILAHGELLLPGLAGVHDLLGNVVQDAGFFVHEHGRFHHGAHRRGTLGQHVPLPAVGDDGIVEGKGLIDADPARIVHVGQRAPGRADGGPDIALDGLRTLVEDGRGHLRAGRGEQGEAVVAVRRRGVQEAREAQRQGGEGLGLEGRNGIGEGLLVAEPEHLERQVFRIGGLAREADQLQGAVPAALAAQRHDAFLEQAVAVAVELGDDPGRAGGGADLQGDAVGVVDFLEEGVHVHVEGRVAVGGLDEFDAGIVVIAFARVADGRSRGPDLIQAGREAGQIDREGFPVGRRAAEHGLALVEHLIRNLQGRMGLAVAVAQLEAELRDVLADDGTVAVAGRAFKAAGDAVLHRELDGQVAGHVHAPAEFERLARGVRDRHGHRHAGGIVFELRGLEIDLEIARGAERQLALGKRLVVLADLVTGAGGAEMVAGV